ncbi:MAG: hypothetical protein ACOCWA_01685 [Bacteroidota bacterium]
MKIELIRKNELESYARRVCKEFSSDIPITLPRAVSQSRNPDAKADDILLIVAREGKKLLSFIGIYPSRVRGEPSRKIYWVSCWWKANSVSSSVSKIVLEKFLEISRENIGLPHLPPHIIKTLTKYDIKVEGRKGLMIRFRSAIHERSYMKSIKGKYSSLIKFLRKTAMLKTYDRIINPFKNKNIIPGKNAYDKGFEIIHTSPPDEYYRFIDKRFKDYLTLPSKENIEWILSNPWLVNRAEADPEVQKRYHFSYSAENYHYFFPVLIEERKMTGAGFFSVRDGAVKSLFIFVLPGSEEKFLKNTTRYIQSQKSYHTLITYEPLYYSFLKDNMNTGIKYHEIKRYTGVGKPEFLELQFSDGDGDSCFT